MIAKFFPKVKCSRCDRSYPGLKNKCPHCGATRGRSGKRAADVSDSQVRMILRGLVLLTLVVTIISAFAIDFDEDPQRTPASPATRPGASQPQGDEGENGENGPPDVIPLPTPPPPTPTPIAVTSLDFNWQFKVPGGANDITVPLGQSLQVWAETFPVDAEVSEIRWATSNNTVVNHTIDHNDHSRVELLARGRGTAIITVTVGEVSNELTVRVS